MRVDAHAARPELDARLVEAEAGEVGDAAGAVDDELGADVTGAGSTTRASAARRTP